MQRLARSSTRSALVNWALRFQSKNLLQHDLQHRIQQGSQMPYAILARNPLDTKASLKSVKKTKPKDESKVLDEYFYHNGEIVLCFCGVAALQKIAGPKASKPGFRYLTCPNAVPWFMKMRNVPSKGPSCHFFRWVDPSGVMLEQTKSSREMKAEKAVKKKKLTCFTKSSSGSSEAKLIITIQKPETETEGTSKEAAKGKKEKTGAPGNKVSTRRGAQVKDELSAAKDGDSKLHEVEQKDVATVQGPIADSNAGNSLTSPDVVETEKQLEGGSLSDGADVKKLSQKASPSSKNKGTIKKSGEADPTITVSLDSISSLTSDTGCTSVKTKASTINWKLKGDDAEVSLERTKAETVSTNTFSEAEEPVKKVSPAVKAKGTRASALKEKKSCEVHDLNEPLSLDTSEIKDPVEVKDVLNTANSPLSENKPSDAGLNKGAVDLPSSAVKELSSATENISALCPLDTVSNGSEPDVDKNVGKPSLSGNMVEDGKNSERSFGNTQVKPLCACKVSKPAVMKNVWFEPVGKVLRYWSCANHQATKVGCLFFRWIDDPMVPEKLSKQSSTG